MRLLLNRKSRSSSSPPILTEPAEDGGGGDEQDKQPKDEVPSPRSLTMAIPHAMKRGPSPISIFKKTSGRLGDELSLASPASRALESTTRSVETFSDNLTDRVKKSVDALLSPTSAIRNLNISDDDSASTNSADIGDYDDDEYDRDHGPEQLVADDDDAAFPIRRHSNVQTDVESSIIGGNPAGVDSDDLDNDETPGESFSTQKIFSFSLPFGSNGPSKQSRLSSLRSVLSAGRLKEESDEKELQREEIRAKLSRQESISTLEEALLFEDVTKLQDNKIDALIKSLRPAAKLPVNTLLPDYLRIFEEFEGDVIVLGGYRGSILRDSVTKRRAWIPVLKAGLNIKKIDLLLGPNDEDELNAEEKIYADGILSHIGPVDICKKLLTTLEANPKIKLHNFGYDWRLSLDIPAAQLHELLKQIKARSKKGALIIAHSMGGLVSHSAMIKDPSLVRGIIYVGTPAPCANIMGPLRFADHILLCKDLLTSEVNFMMRSSFVFMPRNGELFKDKNTGELYNVDFFDPKNWIEYNLSPIVSSIRLAQEAGQPVPLHVKQQTKFAISFEEAYKYLCRTLKRTTEFLDSLEYDESLEYPPMAVVYGNTVPSVRYSLVDGIDEVKQGKYYHFFYGPGDGVTNQKWVFPENRGFPLVGKFNSHKGHVALLTDLESVGKAMLAIVRAEQQN
ncbi:hypothetical protein OGAPHI_005344 [Ogataea philodendri]|uniref:Uncharacterized protein n=2 Tax=Saccharomycotina TaxID=147537 RepID=A0A9P8P1H2_9ASCO|nr:uncharacterized protein OGAPHI_005344 [Ogataea philodendri]KAH3663354.1 hypothetical protein OGAPHI_005344 [Ogataea philodendri]